MVFWQHSSHGTAESFRISSPTLKHWWIKWKILPRAHGDFVAPQAEHTGGSTAPKAQFVAVCWQKYRHFLQLRSHYSERDFHDRLENGMRLWFLCPLHVFSLFLLFHIFHVALTRCFTLPVGHMQESSLMCACHGLLPDPPSGHQAKKAFALPCQELRKLPHISGLPSIAGKTK